MSEKSDAKFKKWIVFDSVALEHGEQCVNLTGMEDIFLYEAPTAEDAAEMYLSDCVEAECESGIKKIYTIEVESVTCFDVLTSLKVSSKKKQMKINKKK